MSESTKINLLQFCSREEMRPYLHKPSSRGDWTYATNGHIMVRVPRLSDAPEVEHFPYTQSIKMFTDFTLVDPVPLAKYEWPEHEETYCAHCDGTGREHGCSECIHECGYCDGAGIEARFNNISAEIGGVPFAANYVSILATLPSIEVPTAVHASNPMPFRFDGGQGLLMPRKTECNTHIKPK